MLTRVGTLYFHLPLILYLQCYQYFLHSLRRKLIKRCMRSSEWRRLWLLRGESSHQQPRLDPVASSCKGRDSSEVFNRVQQHSE